MSVRREVLGMFTFVTGALLLATVIVFVIRFQRKDGKANPVVDNLTARVKSWWIMVTILGVALLAGPRALIVLFALVSFLALREFITLTPTRKADHGALLLSFFVILPMQYGLIWVKWYGFFAVLIPVYALLILPIASMAFRDTTSFLARASEMQWGLMICVYCISHVPALLTLTIAGYTNRTPLLVIFLLVVAQSSDIFQYVFGKLAGRHKIAPEISPSKTVEGFIGGAVTATALGAGLWRMTPFNPWQATTMAIIITLMGFLGGLVMSAIKRDLAVKDWGRLIEGHGGVLDRLDSVAFSAPIFFHLTRYLFA